MYMFEIGNYVSRKSYNNDTIFKIIDIKDRLYILKGVDIRLFADAEESDLVKSEYEENDDEFLDNVDIRDNLDRSEFFYLPGKILHIDGDKDYLNRCMQFYKKVNVYAVGEHVNERDLPNVVGKLLKKYKPDILIVTGHDSLNKKTDLNNINNYKNSKNFVKAVYQAREYEKSHDKLIIIAGACQSNYEELIKAGANFASSPKRINIHALDPAIIASSIAFSLKNQSIDLINLIEKTKYGSDGMGGIITNGTMYVGYPR